MATRRKASQTQEDQTAESGSEGADLSRAAVLSFEEAMSRLSEIVDELEGGELNLETSLQRFEEGIQLARKSQARLDEAEAKVEELLGFDDEGTPITDEI